MTGRGLYDPVRTRLQILIAVAKARGWTIRQVREWLGEIEPERVNAGDAR